MFGISDPGIYMAYLLVFLCTAFAVIYGIINWNKGGEIDKKELEKDVQWEKKEKSIKKKLTD